MARQRLRAVLFGPHGSGKGTQGQLLAERFDVPFLSIGDLLRTEIQRGTRMGELIDPYVNEGLLVPDEMLEAIVLEHLNNESLTSGCVIEGYPRNIEQAAYLERFVKINLAIYLKISDTVASHRLRGRERCLRCLATFHVMDVPSAEPGVCSYCGAQIVRTTEDQEDGIRRRLATYHFMTEPLVGYFRQKGSLLVVNGEQAIPYVFEEMLKKIAKLGLYRVS